MTYEAFRACERCRSHCNVDDESCWRCGLPLSPSHASSAPLLVSRSSNASPPEWVRNFAEAVLACHENGDEANVEVWRYGVVAMAQALLGYPVDTKEEA